jgi:hypothetical protein
MHGVTLERILTELVEHFGWKAMGERIAIRCFTSDPSVPSSLKFFAEDAVGPREGGGDVPPDGPRPGGTRFAALT